MKTVTKNVRWTRKLRNEKFANMVFEELLVFSRKIENCEFHKVDFKHSTLGSGTTYTNCKFIKCSFTGKYTSLGRSDFINCRFEACVFQCRMIFWGPFSKIAYCQEK